jgi:hypothetical protein
MGAKEGICTAQGRPIIRGDDEDEKETMVVPIVAGDSQP